MRFLVVVFLLVSTFSFGQTFEMESLLKETKNGSISGIVADNEFDNEPLAFASIAIKETNTTLTSELDGSFSVDLKPGIYTLEFSFIGYEPIIVENVLVKSNTTTTANQNLKAVRIASISIASQVEK